ncbi:MAG: CHAT domain-containing protein [Elainellaceae cyanobacterium]
MASLWQVSDGGTQALMHAFYAAMQNGYREAEALQRAQMALITRDESVLMGQRGVRVTMVDSTVDSTLERSLSQSDDLAHPYDWAPFILIGNGL